MSVFNEIAKNHNLSTETVKTEIAAALAVGFQNQNPEVRSVWLDLFPDGNLPTPENALYILTKYVLACKS